jgi:hypothetical protein
MDIQTKMRIFWDFLSKTMIYFPTRFGGEMKRIPPWLTLLVLGPLLGEIVSGHQAPLELCNPLSVLLLMLPYGFGALLCQELVIRWRKGWPSLLLLGIAYALYEEGIVVRSIFNPAWTELETMETYSHVFGVTWTYALILVHFHVLISIAASIILAEIIHPAQRAESWLGKKGLIACAAGLLLWFPAGWLMTDFRPSLALYLLCMAVIAGLILAAWKIPAGLPAPKSKPVPHPVFFLLLGFFNMTIFFLAVYVLPEHWLPPLVTTIAGLLALDAVTLWLLLRWSGNGGAWNDLHRLGWVAGGLGFFILFNIAGDLEQFEGKSLVAIIAIAGLWLLRRRIKRRTVIPPERPHT